MLDMILTSYVLLQVLFYKNTHNERNCISSILHNLSIQFAEGPCGAPSDPAGGLGPDFENQQFERLHVKFKRIKLKQIVVCFTPGLIVSPADSHHAACSITQNDLDVYDL